MLLTPPKQLNLLQLKRELDAANVVVNALGSEGDPASKLYTYDNHGNIAELPDAATAVVAAHVALPEPAVVERTAAQSDLSTTAQALIDRLDEIINAPSPTNAQVLAAVRDLARFQKRVVRYLKSQL